MNYSARPRPLPPLRLLALSGLALCAVAIVLWCAREAYAQGRAPGVGVPIPASIPAEWRSSWCPQLRIKPDNLLTWAKPEVFAAMAAASCPPGTPPGPDGAAPVCPWDWQARCREGWQGWWAEHFPKTRAALIAGWETNAWGTRNSHDGAWTLREIEYAQVFIDKCNAFYRLWWEHSDSSDAFGSPAHPYTFTPEGTAAHARIVEQIKADGAWPAFGETGLWPGGPAPCNGWPYWIRNEVGDAPAPTPTPSISPSPTPDPTATPSPTPVATPTPEPPCVPLESLLPQPAQRATLEEMGTWDKRLSAVRRRKLRELAAWWAGLRDWTKQPSTGRLDYCVVSETP